MFVFGHSSLEFDRVIFDLDVAFSRADVFFVEDVFCSCASHSRLWKSHSLHLRVAIFAKDKTEHHCSWPSFKHRFLSVRVIFYPVHGIESLHDSPSYCSGWSL